jgi:rhodanese-related sulfurtransferase
MFRDFIFLGIQTGTSVTWETVDRAVQWPLSIAFLGLTVVAVTWACTAYYVKRSGWDGATALFASLPGALSLPDAHRDEMYPLLAEMFSPSQRLLVYCSGQTCDESLQLSLYLRDHGHTNLVLYIGGIKEWEAAGGPVER